MSDDRPVALDYATPRRRPSEDAVRRWWRRWRGDASMLGATFVLAASVAMLVSLGVREPGDPHTIVLTICALPASIALLANAWGGGSVDCRPRRLTRWLGGIVAGIVAIGLVHVHSCPHATYFDVGPVPLFAIAGRACGNQQWVESYWPAAFLRSLFER